MIPLQLSSGVRKLHALLSFSEFFHLLKRVKIIPVPRAADVSLAAQAEQLRLQGFVIRSASADRLLVDVPRSPDTTIFEAAHWTRGPGLLITRSEAGITMTSRPAVARMVLGSALPGAVVGSAFAAHAPLRAAIIGLGVALAAFAFSYTRARRQKPTMLQFTDSAAPQNAQARSKDGQAD